MKRILEMTDENRARLEAEQAKRVENKTKHTPGPWGVWSIGGHQVVTDNALGRHLARIGHLATIVNGEPEHEASARLIAAAPELLDALEESLALLDEAYTWNSKHGDNLWRDYPRVQNNARAAIAKARGGAA